MAMLVSGRVVLTSGNPTKKKHDFRNLELGGIEMQILLI